MIMKMRNKINLEKKKQWSWADNTHPDDINETHINQAFLLFNSRCKPLSNHRCCYTNPFCLSGLGEQRWLQNKVIPIEIPELRQINTFCGLENLGSTCYVNSLLQLWYHNVEMRNAILNWDPTEDEFEGINPTLYTGNVYEPATGIGHLQLVFALMLFGKQQTLNPEKFILTLKIDISIEQDAEEFSNLLLTAIESRFEKQTNTFVRDMVKNNFLGEYQSVITCLTCKSKSASCSTFRDLSLSIEGHQTLNCSLQDYLKEEILDGDDQYYCSKCNKKQNAVRQICLTALPKVLNFKLMRFVYDRHSMQKKKLNTFIRFPQTLDMGPYLNSQDKLNVSSRENVKYNLYAVLIHIGPSANCGHFVAQIKDDTTKQWYQFNDDKVEKLIPKGLNLCTDDEFKRLKPMRNIKSYDDEFQTNDAYMLVYMKDTKANKLNTELTIPCSLAPRLAQLVNDHNDNIENEILEGKQGKVFVEQMLNLINEIKHSQINENEGDIISLEWLKYWLKLNPNETVKKINNNAILCKHNLLDPDKVYEAKYIGSDLADKLYGIYQGGPRLKLMSSFCYVCVRNKCALMYSRTLTATQSQSITRSLQNWSPTNNLDGENEETSYWVGNETFKCWQIKYFKSFQTFLKKSDILPNTTFPIDHKMLSSVFEPYNSLWEINVKGDTEQENFDIVMDADNMIKPKYYDTHGESKTNAEWENNLLQSTSLEDMYKNDGYDCLQIINNIERLPWVFNCDIMCVHGNMTNAKDTKTLVPEKVKNLFQSFFPKASFFVKATEPCHICKNVHTQVMLCKSLRLGLAKIESFFLNDLLSNTNRCIFSKEFSPYACISMEFWVALQKFVKHPLKEPIPKSIKNRALLCQDHNKLLYRPISSYIPTQHKNEKFVLVTKTEWRRLLQFFEYDFGVFAYFDNQNMFKISNPGICETCHEKKLNEDKMAQFKYNNGKIFIQVEETEDQDWMSSNCSKKFKRDTTVSVNGTSGLGIASVSMNTDINSPQHGVRRSERKRMPKIESVVVSSDSSLLYLKFKIMEVFHVMPTNQCLKTVEGLELLNHDATMEDLKIVPNSVILAQFDEPKTYKPEVVTAKESGFEGTELMS